VRVVESEGRRWEVLDVPLARRDLGGEVRSLEDIIFAPKLNLMCNSGCIGGGRREWRKIKMKR